MGYFIKSYFLKYLLFGFFLFGCSQDPISGIPSNLLDGVSKVGPQNQSLFNRQQPLRFFVNGDLYPILVFKEGDTKTTRISLDFLDKELEDTSLYSVQVEVIRLKKLLSPSATWDYDIESRSGILKWEIPKNFIQGFQAIESNSAKNVILEFYISIQDKQRPKLKTVLKRSVNINIFKKHQAPSIAGLRDTKNNHSYKKLEDGQFYRVPKDNLINLRLNRKLYQDQTQSSSEQLEIVEVSTKETGKLFDQFIISTAEDFSRIINKRPVQPHTIDYLKQAVYDKHTGEDSCQKNKYVEDSQDSNFLIKLQKFMQTEQETIACYFEVTNHQKIYYLDQVLARVSKNSAVKAQKNQAGATPEPFITSEVFSDSLMDWEKDIYEKLYKIPSAISVLHKDNTSEEISASDLAQQKKRFILRISSLKCNTQNSFFVKYVDPADTSGPCYQTVPYSQLIKNPEHLYYQKTKTLLLPVVADNNFKPIFKKLSLSIKMQLAGYTPQPDLNFIFKSSLVKNPRFLARFYIDVQDTSFLNTQPQLIFEQVNTDISFQPVLERTGFTDNESHRLWHLEFSVPQEQLYTKDKMLSGFLNKIFVSLNLATKAEDLFAESLSYNNLFQTFKMSITPYIGSLRGDKVHLSLQVSPTPATKIIENQREARFLTKTQLENKQKKYKEDGKNNSSADISSSLSISHDITMRHFFSYSFSAQILDASSLNKDLDNSIIRFQDATDFLDITPQFSINAGDACKPSSVTSLGKSYVVNSGVCSCSPYQQYRSEKYKKNIYLESNCNLAFHMDFETPLKPSSYFFYNYSLKNTGIRTNPSIFDRVEQLYSGIYLFKTKDQSKLYDISAARSPLKLKTPLTNYSFIYDLKPQIECQLGLDKSKRCFISYELLFLDSIESEADVIEALRTSYDFKLECLSDNQACSCSSDFQFIPKMVTTRNKTLINSAVFQHECVVSQKDTGQIKAKLSSKQSGTLFINKKQDGSLELNKESKLFEYHYSN